MGARYFRLSSPRVVPSGGVLVPPDAAVCVAVSVGTVAGDLGRVGHFPGADSTRRRDVGGREERLPQHLLKEPRRPRRRGTVPRRQAELVEHVGGQAEDTVTLCTRHKGFIKIAIEKRAHLVPVFCFGESQALTNLWKWKAAQRWTYK